VSKVLTGLRILQVLWVAIGGSKTIVTGKLETFRSEKTCRIRKGLGDEIFSYQLRRVAFKPAQAREDKPRCIGIKNKRLTPGFGRRGYMETGPI